MASPDVSEPRVTAAPGRVHESDLAIVGFGFSGLSTLAHLVAAGLPISVAIAADDHSGRGLAYGTEEPRHLLNVVSRRMGAWAMAPGDFGDWLAGSEARCACQTMEVPVPGLDDFAPRALYGAYLASVRARVLTQARAIGMRLRWIDHRVDRIARHADGGWWIEAGPAALRAQAVVIATSNEPRQDVDMTTHRSVSDLRRRPPRDDGDPAVLIGTGLSAVDALLTLRAGGFAGPIVALSRTGLLPRAHMRGNVLMQLDEAELAALGDVSAIVRFVRARPGVPGDGWRERLDSLRPHTAKIWQRLSAAQQLSALRRWSTWWSVHRHRMAPDIAEVIEPELAAGGLRVLAVREVDVTADVGRMRRVMITARDGATERLRATAVVNCTGSQLDVRRSRDPLLPTMVRDGLVSVHHTGIGLVADEDLRVGDALYAVGSLLVGQLWESIAVPELREQSASIAAAVVADLAGLRRRGLDGRLTRQPGSPMMSVPTGHSMNHRSHDLTAHPTEGSAYGVMSTLSDKTTVLSGYTALVTGGSRGIGAGIAEALDAAGAGVAIGYRSRDAEVELMLRRLRPGATAHRADLTDEAQAHGLVDEVTRRHGGLDMLVLNAGVWRGGRIDQLPAEDWRFVIDGCLTSAYHVTHRAVPWLRRSGRGRLVIVSSVIGLSGFAGDGAYAAAKAGLIGLTRSLARELGRDGVTVNAVAPGYVETEMTQEIPDGSREKLLARTAIRRPGSVEDVASAVRFLLCDGDYVTGHVLVVDGGLTL
jgi:3-oxoacyl-[acyl-carrier protein] reductase